MSFLDRLRGMLRGLNQPESSPQSPKSITATSATPTVNHTEALILVHHLDNAGNELQTPDMIAGTIGDEIHLPDVTIDGFHLVHIDGLTRWFTTAQASITLTYERQAGQPVWMYAYDIDRRELIGRPTMYRGQLRTAYEVTAPTVAGFKLLRSVGDVTGEYTTISKTVLFFYRNQNWQQTDLSTGFIQIHTLTKVFPYPGATTTQYPTRLQPGSTYKTYMRVRLTDHTIWYEIGGDQWIPESHLQLTTGDNLLLKLPAGYHVQNQRAVQQTGIVSFVPGKHVHTYSEPYGRYLGTVDHGTTVNLIERLADDNGVVWYRLQDQGYLPGRYLTHLDPPYL
ncbi:MucBP domain-containing protein [Lactiplantibacillus herbarum]|uniref:MucBP domain-containing protein n=1 Tax=Lactiplantibacillus herbarum TaxID=1670446 RepID=UPI00064EA5EF|nr:MucBP domain-containing protein [Lactiplantibacillus herbarum]